MAAEFEVCFPAACRDGDDLAIEALDLVESLEEQLSYFRPASDVSRINRLAADEPVGVGPELFELLSLAMRLHAETDGAYDITSARLWELWGFARRQGRVPSEAEVADACRCVGGHLLELDPTNHTVRFRKPGVQINLASIGKGYALDRCAQLLLRSGMNDFLLHGGQSSVLARGSPHGDSPGEDCPSSRDSENGTVPLGTPSGPNGPHPRPLSQRERGECGWQVGVRDPRRPDQRLAVVLLNNRALGTSGSQFQSFRHKGQRLGHILDPRSGRPAQGVVSATVTAPSAALADALSTAFYVMGPELARAYCESHPGIGMILLCEHPSKGTEIHEWDAHGFRCAVTGPESAVADDERERL
jgi:FAD:protein FMN transferase